MIEEQKQTSALSVTNTDIVRMDPRWRQKLWIDFDRDDEIEIPKGKKEKNQDPLDDVEELRIDNHSGTEDYLTHLYEHIKQAKTKITFLEIAKILINGPKAEIIAQILKLPNCEIEELVFDQCRARSDKMGSLFKALTHNVSVMNLTLKNMNIPRDSLAEMGDMFRSNNTIKMLTLYNTGLSDSAIQMLAQGIEQSPGLIYLDIRQNTYEAEGFEKLINSITGIDSLLTLRINAVQIKENEVRLLHQLFSHKNCRITDLEMEELEVSDSMSKDVIEAVCQVKHLLAFDFSNNQLPYQMTESIIKMISKYENLEILCIDHCEVTDSIANNIFNNMANTKLQFLNIGWNNISGESLKDFEKVLELNQGLEKLAMQHNRFGEGDLTQFAHILSQHQSLSYLDISANSIENRDFVQIYQAIQGIQSKISTFHCRKNEVGGQEIDSVLQLKSLHVSIINLSGNELTDSNSLILFEYAKENCFLENLDISQNILISAQILNDINQQCRQNILIKRNILNMLPQTGRLEMVGRVLVNNCYSGYDVSNLSLTNKTLDHVDFICKFAHQNVIQLKKLEFTSINFTNRVQIQLQQLFNPKDEMTFQYLKILHIQDCNLTKKSVKKMLRSLKLMKNLEEIHLVNLAPLEELMGELAEAVKKQKFLKVLDLRQDALRMRKISHLVPLLQNSQVLDHLDISGPLISKNNMKLLWLALYVNASVHKLSYSRTNFFAIEEIFAIDKELSLNQIIREEILPEVYAKNNLQGLASEIKNLCLRGYKFPPQNNPAVVKFIKTRKQLQELDVSATNLRQADIDQIIKEIVKRHIKLTSLNLSDNSAVNDDVVKNLCYLFTNSSTIENLELENTSITIDGVIELLASISQSLKVRTISVQGCKLKLDGEKGRNIVQLLKQNISLTDFKYQNNGQLSQEFITDVEKEINLNKQIAKMVLPQLIQQENEAREKKEAERKEMLEANNNDAPVITQIITEENNAAAYDENVIAVQHIKSFSSQQDKNGSDSSGFSFSLSQNGDEDDEKEDKKVQSQSGFDLSMSGFNLKDGIGFITKFTRVFRQISKIDFGANMLQDDEMNEFSEQLKLNRYIQEIVIQKKGTSKQQKHLIEAEIQKNIAINEISTKIGQEDLDTSYGQQSELSLADQKFNNLRFLPKMMKDFQNLQTFDLSNTDLRAKETVAQLCQMIDDNNTITNLVLRHCNINGNTLNKIAEILTKANNKHLIMLDISDNPIQDPQLKVLFGLLQNNETLLEVKYTLYDEPNIKSLDKFQSLNESGKSLVEIQQILEEDAHHAHHGVPLWQKICFPIWIWKSLIHDKHEAFRFKYDTTAMKRVEKQIMPSTKMHLYLWSIIYYALTFVVPYFFLIHECNKTYDMTLFYWYGLYLLLCGLWEIYIVLKIQRLLRDKKLLQFNSWHVVELFMGAIARTDTFLDICFIHIVMNCFEAYINWAIPTLTFALLNFAFPLIMLIRLLLLDDSGNTLYQPYMESTCFASFIRENMLLATVLDSFCINNSFYVRGYPLVFGKLMGFVSFFTQDFPQLTIHVLFKLVITSPEQKVLKKEKLLLIGMMVSATACCISTFNMIMCTQNEFDPIVLEGELKKRNDKIKQEKEIAAQEAEEIRQRELSAIEAVAAIKALAAQEPLVKKKSFFTQIEDKFKAQNDDVSQANKELQDYMTYLKTCAVPERSIVEEVGISKEADAIEISEIQNENFLPSIPQKAIYLNLTPTDKFDDNEEIETKRDHEGEQLINPDDSKPINISFKLKSNAVQPFTSHPSDNADNNQANDFK